MALKHGKRPALTFAQIAHALTQAWIACGRVEECDCKDCRLNRVKMGMLGDRLQMISAEYEDLAAEED